MLGVSRFRQIIFLLITAVWLVLCLPALLGPRLASRFLPAFVARHTLTFGLDLSGGAHLLLEVQKDKFLDDHYGFLLTTLRKKMQNKGVRYRRLKNDGTCLRFVSAEKDTKRIVAAVKEVDASLVCEQEENIWSCRLNESAVEDLVARARDKSIETIRRRVDETGTKEPLIQSQGKTRILLQVPGTEDPSRVKELVGKTARLTFHMVEGVLPLDEAQTFHPSADQEVLLDGEARGRERGAGFAYVVNKEVLLNGDMLVDAQPAFGEYNQPQVAFVFNGLGSEIFESVTRENAGKLFAIVVDGRVISAPRINEPIAGGRGVITGQFTTSEAQDLSLLMRSGALPAPLKVLEERVIGPGLGVDSVSLGVIATVAAIVIVVGLIFLAYGWFGSFANIALVLNLCLLLGSMGLIEATLTLPGIAGIALTLGMAVDANVLINERIREEIAAGRRFIPAIDAGYQRAMTTIIDSNLTTLIGAFLLYMFGTGPVRGFSVTLALGIFISMFTAVGVSKILVALWLRVYKPKTVWL